MVDGSMNICLALISDGMGGAEVVTHDLAEHLMKKGDKVFLILSNEMKKGFEDLSTIEKIYVGPWYREQSIQKMGNHKVESAIIRDSMRFLSIYYDEMKRKIRSYVLKKRIMDFLLRNRIDVIHSHRADTDIFIHRLKQSTIPMMTTIHGEHALTGRLEHNILSRPLVFMKSSIFKHALCGMQLICAVSESEMCALRRWGIPSDKRIRVIHNGVDVAFLQHISSHSVMDDSKFNILFPGGSKWYKGGDLLIQSLRNLKVKIPSFHLYIAMSVKKDDPMIKMVSKVGLNDCVTFLGALERDTYLRYLRETDILVMPSRREAFPISILEAMAMGKPIVATGIGGIIDILTHRRNGLIVEDNPESISDAIVLLAANPELRKQIGINNAQDIQRYRWGNIIDEYCLEYRNLALSDLEGRSR